MLHMVVNTHTEESCAFRNDANKEALMTAFAKLAETSDAPDIEIEGVWANMAGHTVFVLVDAPNAHVIDAHLRQSGLVGQTSTNVYAVEPMEAAVAAVESH